MTDEEAAFNAALDAHPGDWVTRLVFADWLEERGDERAEGYRALGALGICCVPVQYTGVFFPPSNCWFGDAGFSFTPARDHPYWIHRHSLIPSDWFALVPESDIADYLRKVWRNFPSRRAGEDAAARAFAKLPAARREELLRGTGVSA